MFNSLSNYPPGMTSRDMDFVEGVGACVVCPVCGKELSWNEKHEVYPCIDCEVFLDEAEDEITYNTDELKDLLEELTKNSEENDD